MVEQRFRKPNGALDWSSFKEYLSKKHSQTHTRDVMSYAMKYSHCLLNKDFQELHSFSVSKRRHVLIALSNLSKFLGEHETFKKLVKGFGLKWERIRAEDLLISRMNKTEEHGEVLEWISRIKNKFPRFTDFMDFILASGLRFVEAINSYNLIIKLEEEGKLSNYYNGTGLEHFRFKQLFLRNKKKALMSIVPQQLIEKISKNKELTVSKLYNPIKRSGFKLRFGDIREFYATYMTKYLTQPEIDFLQGRVSGSVFMRNYFNPALIGDLKARVFKGITGLKGLA